MNHKRIAMGCFALAWTALPAMAQITLYVDDDAALGGDGAGWSSAYRYLQDALSHASTLELAVDIRVAGGVYRPDLDEAGYYTAGDQTASFQLQSIVRLYGGHAGIADLLTPDDRDTILYESTLSGDLNGDDGPNFTNNSDNTYRLVIGSGVSSTAVFDGFTVSGANNNPPSAGPDEKRGGGMHTVGGSPTVRNCLFTGNTAIFGGGAMFNRNGAPTIIDCTFIGNTTGQGGGAVANGGSFARLIGCRFAGNTASFGGAIANDVNAASVTVTQCVFDGNSAGVFGGAISNSYTDLTVTNSVFADNSSGAGGAIRAREGLVSITNSVFTGNAATSAEGGAIAFDNSAQGVADQLMMVNCSFAANSANQGRAIAIDSYQLQDPMTADIVNCIVRDGGSEVWINDGSTVTVAHSNVEGGWMGLGTGNIDSDSLYADPSGADGVAGTVDDDLRLSAGSPCIDMGDEGLLPTDTTDLDGDGDTGESVPVDLDGHARTLCNVVDMGAYEFGVGDYNCDQAVDLGDFGAWDACMTGPNGGPYEPLCMFFDADGDRDVDLDDYLVVQAGFTGP